MNEGKSAGGKHKRKTHLAKRVPARSGGGGGDQNGQSKKPGVPRGGVRPAKGMFTITKNRGATRKKSLL